MSKDRLLDILERLASKTAGGASLSGSLCTTAAEVLDVPGVGLLLVDDSAFLRSLGITTTLMATVEELQHTFGEGPCVDAYQRGAPVLEPHLAEPRALRWVGFTPPAVEAGARAVFGFPLGVGAVRIGALNLCSERAGPLTAAQHADALALADVATHTILAVQSDAPPEMLASELEDIGMHQVVVHQATGMLSVQLGVAIKDAYLRLRAHAFVTDHPISVVAADIVARRLRLDP